MDLPGEGGSQTLLLRFSGCGEGRVQLALQMLSAGSVRRHEPEGDPALPTAPLALGSGPSLPLVLV